MGCVHSCLKFVAKECTICNQELDFDGWANLDEDVEFVNPEDYNNDPVLMHTGRRQSVAPTFTEHPVAIRRLTSFNEGRERPSYGARGPVHRKTSMKLLRKQSIKEKPEPLEPEEPVFMVGGKNLSQEKYVHTSPTGSPVLSRRSSSSASHPIRKQSSIEVTNYIELSRLGVNAFIKKNMHERCGWGSFVTTKMTSELHSLQSGLSVPIIQYFRSHSRLISGPNQCLVLADTYSKEIRVNTWTSPAIVCLLKDQVKTIIKLFF